VEGAAVSVFESQCDLSSQYSPIPDRFRLQMQTAASEVISSERRGCLRCAKPLLHRSWSSTWFKGQIGPYLFSIRLPKIPEDLNCGPREMTSARQFGPDSIDTYRHVASNLVAK